MMGLTIAGLDEVGRGPIAGPVVAAAVVLNRAAPIAGLRDSKALSEPQRRQFRGCRDCLSGSPGGGSGRAGRGLTLRCSSGCCCCLGLHG